MNKNVIYDLKISRIRAKKKIVKVLNLYRESSTHIKFQKYDCHQRSFRHVMLMSYRNSNNESINLHREFFLYSAPTTTIGAERWLQSLKHR